MRMRERMTPQILQVTQLREAKLWGIRLLGAN
jgi:hypothetical protein